MRRAVVRVGLGLLLATGGCSATGRAPLSGSWLRPKGEEWTILCAEVRGAARRQQAQTLAAQLKEVQGLRPDRVSVHHADHESLILYGVYYRQIDPQTGRLNVSDDLRRDLVIIQQNAPQRNSAFLGARPTSSPSTDVGNPAWRLENATGTYSLLIAVFENTPDFYDRKAVAAQYAESLHKKGHDAYYRHGPIASEVTIGSFGPDALIQTERTHPSGGRYLACESSVEVQRLQSKEDFRFLLLNGRKQVLPGGTGDSKPYVASRLVPIRPEGD